MRVKCEGGIPTEVVQDIRRYRLGSGGTHTLPGKAVCPTCGRVTGYFGPGKKIAHHKKDVD